MAVLTVNSVSNLGLSIATDGEAAANGGDTFANNGSTYLAVDNSDASPHTLTFATPDDVDGDLSVGDRQVVVAVGDQVIIGPFAASVYNDGNGDIGVTYDDETGLTILVYKRGN